MNEGRKEGIPKEKGTREEGKKDEEEELRKKGGRRKEEQGRHRKVRRH